ncbi:MAG: DUF2239 family protein [Hyphomicrobiales bacterium]|nr:DUF2239 family protein [Hyphomicrobiales bacterium]
MTQIINTTYTLFRDGIRLASGSMPEINSAAASDTGQSGDEIYACFNDSTGEFVDLESRIVPSSKSSGLKRGRPSYTNKPSSKPKKVGRPSLGVVAREVTLLPRHWQWLGSQPSSASAVLRRLIDDVIRSGSNPLIARNAMARTDKFMSIALGNQPGYEEASRALYRGDKSQFEALIENWPDDLREYTKQLAGPAFVGHQSK